MEKPAVSIFEGKAAPAAPSADALEEPSPTISTVRPEEPAVSIFEGKASPAAPTSGALEGIPPTISAGRPEEPAVSIFEGKASPAAPTSGAPEGTPPTIAAVRPEEPAVSIFEHRRSAVVQVTGCTDLKSDSAQILEGSGFFIDEQAHVVVASSVVASAEKIWVERGDESFAAEKIGSDPETNLALLRLLKKPERFTPISLKEETEGEVRIGSTLVSIGSKLGMEPGPNQGLLTGQNLFYGEHKFLVPYWRSSLAMDGGESGSPVFDLQGNFIGVLIASLPEIRSSFILPAFAVRRVVDELLQTGSVSHVSLGFSARQELRSDGSHRLSIIQVSKDSPAGKAGLQVGDELLRLNGQTLSRMEDLVMAIFHLHPNETALLNLSRREKENPLEISITTRSR